LNLHCAHKDATPIGNSPNSPLSVFPHVRGGVSRLDSTIVRTCPSPSRARPFFRDDLSDLSVDPTDPSRAPLPQLNRTFQLNINVASIWPRNYIRPISRWNWAASTPSPHPCSPRASSHGGITPRQVEKGPGSGGGVVTEVSRWWLAQNGALPSSRGSSANREWPECVTAPTPFAQPPINRPPKWKTRLFSPTPSSPSPSHPMSTIPRA
jgi:hypothetical protein